MLASACSRRGSGSHGHRRQGVRRAAAVAPGIVSVPAPRSRLLHASPDRTVRHGHIPGQGSVWVRRILCEAAQKAKHSLFAASYQTIRSNPAKWSGLCR